MRQVFMSGLSKFCGQPLKNLQEYGLLSLIPDKTN